MVQFVLFWNHTSENYVVFVSISTTILGKFGITQVVEQKRPYISTIRHHTCVIREIEGQALCNHRQTSGFMDSYLIVNGCVSINWEERLDEGSSC
jgi:hypothetical protein